MVKSGIVVFWIVVNNVLKIRNGYFGKFFCKIWKYLGFFIFFLNMICKEYEGIIVMRLSLFIKVFFIIFFIWKYKLIKNLRDKL